jgi:hypothetical protein
VQKIIEQQVYPRRLASPTSRPPCVPTINTPSTLLEAFADQILSDADGLLREAGALRVNLDATSEDLLLDAVTLDDASHRFRTAVRSLTEQAIAELSEHKWSAP